jgi:hypothetical protein
VKFKLLRAVSVESFRVVLNSLPEVAAPIPDAPPPEIENLEPAA